MSYNVGINVIETDGRATPSIVPAPTSVGAFVIRSQRGYVVLDDQGNWVNPPRRVSNWSQFLDAFGSYMPDAYGAYAVKGFFDNGGTMAYVTRVVKYGLASAMPGFICSDEGPWNLSRNATLTFNAGDAAGDVTATFIWDPAKLIGKEDAGVTYNLDDGSGADTGKQINFEVNGLNQDVYQFQADDFTALGAATADEIAAVLNRQFSGIKAVVEDGKLVVYTDRGAEASLEALEVGSGEETGAKTMFNEVLSDTSSEDANVAHIDAVTVDEAVAVLRNELQPAGADPHLLVTKVGNRVEVAHPEVGEDKCFSLNASDNSAHLVFAFVDANGQPVSPGSNVCGKNATTTGAALVGAREFLDNYNNGGQVVLTVEAGYRGDPDPGAWGSGLAIKVLPNSEVPAAYDLFVKYGDVLVETWEKLSNGDHANPAVRHPAHAINNEFSGSRYIQVTENAITNPAATDGHPDAVDGYVNLAGGSDDDLGNTNQAGDLAQRAGASLPLFDTKDVQLVCCPETHRKEWISAVKMYCASRGDCMFVGHTERDANVDGVESFVDGGVRGDKVYGALYFPWIQVQDPLNGHLWIPPTGHVLGVYARTERERGIWKAPAGNAAVIRGALDLKYHITDTQHTTLVKDVSVSAVRYKPGKGIVIDSSRTLSTSPLWYYVNIRLLFNFVKTSLKEGLSWVVQEPNDETLWNKIKHNSVRPFLMGLWRRGAFGPGAPEEVFEIKVDSENNTPEMYQQGIVKIEVYFYPNRPAETIVIIVGQQEGGATAAEG